MTTPTDAQTPVGGGEKMSIETSKLSTPRHAPREPVAQSDYTSQDFDNDSVCWSGHNPNAETIASLRENEVIATAKDLVALWQNPTIQALPRADRNAAIEETRNRLIEAVNNLS